MELAQETNKIFAKAGKIHYMNMLKLRELK